MQPSMDQRIEASLDRLSASQRRVGRWITANMARAIDASIREVALAADVSQPTVIRFCRSMGTTGFRDLRKHLIAAEQRPNSYSHHDVASDDDAGAATAKVLESSIRALVDLSGLVGDMPFDAAVNAMCSARQLVLVGVGASGHVVQDARHKFFRLGVPCSTALDAQTISQQAAIAQRGDVFVVVSHTGRGPDQIHAMSTALESGATIIAVTDPASPLAQVATLLFGCHPTEDTNVFTPMTSRLVHLTLLDALQVAMALAMGASAERNLRLTKRALAHSKHPANIPQAADTAGHSQ